MTHPGGDRDGSRERFQKFALLLAACVFSLGLAELIVRALPEDTLGFVYTREILRRPFEYIPDFSLNHFGSHDIEYGAKKHGVRRVLLLGDSFVHGLQVPIPQTVARRLAHHLDALSPRSYDVVALAGPGFSPANELQLLQRHGEALSPDLVVTVFYPGNDAVVEVGATGLKTLDGKYHTLSPYHYRSLQRIAAADARYLVFPWSALNRLISHRVTLAARKRETRGIPLEFLVYAAELDGELEIAWQRTEEMLLRTRAAARRLGADYALASASSPWGVMGEKGLALMLDTYPDMKQWQWDLEGPDRRLAAFAEARRIPFLALQPLFREQMRRDGRRRHWKYDGHWNAEGHDLAAERLARFVIALDAE